MSHSTITPKLLELRTWNFKTVFTTPSVSCVIHHISCVTCHMSHVMCHMSCVTCQVSSVTIFFLFWQSAGASRWRVCYQRGLPRLVSMLIQSKHLEELCTFIFWLRKIFRKSVPPPAEVSLAGLPLQYWRWRVSVSPPYAVTGAAGGGTAPYKAQ